MHPTYPVGTRLIVTRDFPYSADLRAGDVVTAVGTPPGGRLYARIVEAAGVEIVWVSAPEDAPEDRAEPGMGAWAVTPECVALLTEDPEEEPAADEDDEEDDEEEAPAPASAYRRAPAGVTNNYRPLQPGDAVEVLEGATSRNSGPCTLPAGTRAEVVARIASGDVIIRAAGPGGWPLTTQTVSPRWLRRRGRATDAYPPGTRVRVMLDGLPEGHEHTTRADRSLPVPLQYHGFVPGEEATVIECESSTPYGPLLRVRFGELGEEDAVERLVRTVQITHAPA